jgi:hypothetical protein
MARAAGILDGYGGWHAVVGENFDAHVRPGQILLVVPDFEVEHPVPWDLIPWVMRVIEQYVRWWCQTRNDPEEAVKLFLIRDKRTYQRTSVNLYDIVET